MSDRPEAMRLDKWLWAARFYKTRTLAAQAVVRGRVEVNGQPAKPARDVHVGDRLDLRLDAQHRTVQVLGLSAQRGPAPQAQALFAETPESLARARVRAEQRRHGVEPAQTLTQGRPTKRDRRTLADWQRWSASVDDP
jgi:ribosome-associated heat shock protein Hsp15